MQEILKQPQYEPVSLAHQTVTIFAGTNGYADEVLVEKMRQWELDVVKFLDQSHPELARDIVEKKQITTDTDKKLREALATFKSTWQA